jgi:hypothetical protein
MRNKSVPIKKRRAKNPKNFSENPSNNNPPQNAKTRLSYSPFFSKTRGKMRSGGTGKKKKKLEEKKWGKKLVWRIANRIHMKKKGKKISRDIF